MRRGDPDAQTDSRAVRGSEARLEEAVGLARAIDLTVADALVAPVSQIRPATYIGKGKVEEIVGLVTGHQIELVVMDCALSPIQQRNLEKAWNTKVLDRTGLILEIFGRRAKTREGALQVELAHLNYQRSRLVRSWTHLERQRGGFGFLGGPGETQIEADRRLIGERIGKGWRDVVRRRIGRLEGCTHMSELLGPAVTALFQSMSHGKSPEGRDSLRDHPFGTEQPFFINDCYSWRTDGPVVAEFFPQFATKRPDKE